MILFAKTRFTVTHRLFRVEHETASRASRERKTITYTGVQSSDYVLCTVCDSIVVSIPRCHRGDRGSIPRRAAFCLFFWRGLVAPASSSTEGALVRVKRCGEAAEVDVQARGGRLVC